jgi:DNA-binding response OmpR family regulator
MNTPVTKITIIEDEVTILEMYAHKFSSHGFVVSKACNGAEGLTVIQEQMPDLILLDIRMPIMSGDVMLQKLRETSWGSSIRVVMLTNISRDEAPASIRHLGVDRYIVKAHHTPSQVVNIVNEVLGLPKINH